VLYLCIPPLTTLIWKFLQGGDVRAKVRNERY
jgi:hypothetical protein